MPHAQPFSSTPLSSKFKGLIAAATKARQWRDNSRGLAILKSEDHLRALTIYCMNVSHYDAVKINYTAPRPIPTAALSFILEVLIYFGAGDLSQPELTFPRFFLNLIDAESTKSYSFLSTPRHPPRHSISPNKTQH